jgi:CRISPR/Cas system CSM-associated protein Csm3 (group 7 of RAMP superfamily)
MKNYKMKITFISDAIPGSGEGYGAVIDSDIIFDEVGIPFIPAKRIKGCLRESTHDVCTMLKESEAKIIEVNLSMVEGKCKTDKKEKKEFTLVREIFGEAGMKTSAPISFSNFTIKDYKENFDALVYFERTYPEIVSPQRVVQTYTYLRQSTAIDETGIADDHSLRTFRVLKKGKLFEGTIGIENQDPGVEKLLALACWNLRYIGTKRTRGFGEIQCRLFDDQENEINVHI